jgi:hypothetical protein
MSGRNQLVAFKAQPTLGTPVSGAGATVFRYNNGTAGSNLQKAKIRSNESRSDGMSTRGRHGSRSVAGTYPADATLGTFEALIEALHRGTWDGSDLVITEATSGGAASITTTTSTIVGNTGSWITVGLKKGDVIVLSGHSTAANNGIPLRVLDLSATVITVPAGSLTLNATPDTAFTVTRAKKLTNGTTRRLFTFEEIDQDLDQSLQFPDVRVSSLKLTMGTDAEIGFEFGVVGIGTVTALSAGSSPAFTSPTETTGVGLVGVEAKIVLGGTPITTMTSLDAMFDIQCKTQPVIGSNQGPDVYEGNMQPITGNFTGIRNDQTIFSALDAETTVALGLIMRDQAGTGYISLWLPFGTVDSVTKQLGVDGPLMETGSFEFGKLLSGTAVDLSMAVWQSTAA